MAVASPEARQEKGLLSKSHGHGQHSVPSVPWQVGLPNLAACFLRTSQGGFSWKKSIALLCNIIMDVISCNLGHILSGASHESPQHWMRGDYTVWVLGCGDRGDHIRVKSQRNEWVFLYDYSLPSWVCLLSLGVSQNCAFYKSFLSPNGFS